MWAEWAGVGIIADVVLNQTTGLDVAAGEQTGVAAAFAAIGTASRAPVPTMAMATPMPVVRRMQSLTC